MQRNINNVLLTVKFSLYYKAKPACLIGENNYKRIKLFCLRCRNNQLKPKQTILHFQI